jgi:hypothetical protein
VSSFFLIIQQLEIPQSNNNTNQMTTVGSYEKLKELILLEMISRVIKDELNKRMREKMKEIHVPSSRPFDEIIIKFYNMMLTDRAFWCLTYIKF